MHSLAASNRVRLTVYVKTSSQKTTLVREPDGTLTLHVAAAPVKGKANREALRWLARKLRTSSSSVRLVAGFHSNLKVIEITGMNGAEVSEALGIHLK
jgi:uncharacterized protein YggU (UPF0235/DUF167 family)